MDCLTARPERIIGNIALASLLVGVPLGVASSLFEVILQPTEHSILEWANVIGKNILGGPFILFVGGLFVIAPALSLLRYFGYGGPMFVYLIAILFSLAMADHSLAGLGALLLSLPACFVFCRYSYQKTLAMRGNNFFK